jgi:hypothetical protein
LEITEANLDFELQRIGSGGLRFASIAGLNDVLIQIDLGNDLRETDLAQSIHGLLGKKYKPLSLARIESHCGGGLGTEFPHKSAPTTIHKQRREPRIHIRDRENKVGQVIEKIRTEIGTFKDRYRSGAELFFYKRVIALRKDKQKIADFVSDRYSMEIMYATLVAWDMNMRAAKLLYFDEFDKNIKSCLPILETIERTAMGIEPAGYERLLPLLQETYQRMKLMKTESRFVSNAKCLHFLFPSLLMPMDRKNTLNYLFGNTNESVERYIEAVRFSFEIMRQPITFEEYIDDDWNQCIPKLIDNAIILLVGASLKKG